jgi:hypothetical protein
VSLLALLAAAALCGCGSSGEGASSQPASGALQELSEHSGELSSEELAEKRQKYEEAQRNGEAPGEEEIEEGEGESSEPKHPSEAQEEAEERTAPREHEPGAAGTLRET